MRLVRKLFTLSALILTLPINSSAFAYHSAINSPVPKRTTVKLRHELPHHNIHRITNKWQTMNLPDVNTIYVDGNIDLKIISKQPRCKMVVNRVNNYPPGVMCKGNVLAISKNNYSPPPYSRLQVILYVNQISNLFLTGNSRVVGSNIANYCPLDIFNCGNGTLCLTGSNKLRHLSNTGNACITINGICSEHVEIINTHYGVVRLNGNTGALLVRSVQQSFTDARFLRAGTSFIQSSGTAIVYVRAINSLRAFASDCSTIFYFSTPCDLVKHTTSSGNIYQIADW